MNRLSGKITELKTAGSLTLVDIDVNGSSMTAITIGTPDKIRYLKLSSEIELLFNESEVSIGKEISGQISMNNQLQCTIKDIIPGDLFTKIVLTFNIYIITSLITTRSAERLNLKKNDTVTAFIKTNEVMLKETDYARNSDRVLC